MTSKAIIFLLLISIVSCTYQEDNKVSQKESQLTVLYLVRHAEKIKDESDDPALSPTGWQRAKQLEYFFEEEKLDAIYTTPFVRCVQTAIPISKSQGLKFKKYEADRNAEEFVVNLQKEYQGKKVLIVGHKTTLPDMLNALVGKAVYDDLEDQQHSDIFQVFIKGDHVSIQHLKFDAVRNVETSN